MNRRPVDFTLEMKLSEHLFRTGWEDLTEASRQAATRAILWYLATGLEGASEPGQQTVLSYIQAQVALPEATVIGTNVKTSAELAALYNGRAGKAWEHEDKYWVDETIGFAVGCMVVPAALAMAEAKRGVTGKELITAVALGIDLGVRLLRPLGLGFVFGKTAANATFALGNYSGAATAAKILKLNAESIMDALGLAHSQACGNYQGQAEGRGVALQGGFAVRNAITAARMAAVGMPGPRASISGIMGLYTVHFPHAAIDFNQITEGLGQVFLNERLGFKGYPCGVVAHPAIDAAIAARQMAAGRKITKIRLYGPPSLNIMAEPLEVKRAPSTPIEAQFSIPWAIACALHDGHFSVEHCDYPALKSQDIRALSNLVTVEMDEGYVGNRLVLTLEHGSTVEPMVVLASKGHPENPLSNEEINAILRRAARRIAVPEAAVEEIIRQAADLPSLNDVAALLPSLAPAEAQVA